MSVLGEHLRRRGEVEKRRTLQDYGFTPRESSDTVLLRNTENHTGRTIPSSRQQQGVAKATRTRHQANTAGGARRGAGNSTFMARHNNKNSKNNNNNNNYRPINRLTLFRDENRQLVGGQNSNVSNNRAFGHSWGDNKMGNFRAYFQNIIGTNVMHNSDMTVGLGRLKGADVGIFGLAETNRNWKRAELRRGMRANCSMWQHRRLEYSTSNDPCAGEYKPGGTCMATIGKWSSRCYAQGDAPSGMGKWTWMTLRGKADIKVTCITAYRTNAASPQTTGELTAWKQEWRLMALAGISDPDPRQHVLTDLSRFIQNKVDDGHDVIIMIDANQSLSHDNIFRQFASECGLNDIYTHLHEEEGPPSHNRGRRRTDYILGTPRILRAVTQCGYLNFNDASLSDHRAVDSNILFGNFTEDLTLTTMPQLRMDDPGSVSRYLEKMEGTVKEKLLDRLELLTAHAAARGWSRESQERYEALVLEMTRAMLAAERDCARKVFGIYPWNPGLEKAIMTVRYWKMRKSEVQTGSSNVSERAKKDFEHIDDNGSAALTYIKGK
ncbi:MAG: hypothetical protein ACREBR_00680 [bacterium]